MKKITMRKTLPEEAPKGFIRLEGYDEETAIKIAKEFRLRALKNKSGFYFIGYFTQPMMGTIYKPSWDGLEQSTRVPTLKAVKAFLGEAA